MRDEPRPICPAVVPGEPRAPLGGIALVMGLLITGVSSLVAVAGAMVLVGSVVLEALFH